MANVTDHDFKATNRKKQKMKQKMRKDEKYEENTGKENTLGP